MTYHQFLTADENGDIFGSFEVFYIERTTWSSIALMEQSKWCQAGWYWWPCNPGCLPDGGLIGPFDTEQEAYADAIGELS